MSDDFSDKNSLLKSSKSKEASYGAINYIEEKDTQIYDKE